MEKITDKVKNIFTAPFTLFDTLKKRLAFAVGLCLFCLLFLYLFIPFNISEWIVYTSPIKEFGLHGLWLISCFIIFLSHLIQFKLFEGKEMKVYHMLFGLVFDIFFVTIPLSILYAAPESNYLTEFFQTLQLVASILVLWYLIGLSLISLLQIKAERKHQKAVNSPVSASERMNICDDNGQLKLSLRLEDLLFFESADNYVIVYFRKDQRVGKELVRISLKNIEINFAKYNCVRCHRSYIVNMDNASSIKKKGRSYEITVHGSSCVIPVSRSYVKLIQDILNPA